MSCSFALYGVQNSLDIWGLCLVKSPKHRYSSISIHIRWAIFSTILTIPCTAPKMIHNGKITGKKISHCRAIVRLNFLMSGIFMVINGLSDAEWRLRD
jgi:hypothetical protein